MIQTFSRLGETIELYHINIYIFRFNVVAIQAKTNSNLTSAVSGLPGGTASKVFFYFILLMPEKDELVSQTGHENQVCSRDISI